MSVYLLGLRHPGDRLWCLNRLFWWVVWLWANTFNLKRPCLESPSTIWRDCALSTHLNITTNEHTRSHFSTDLLHIHTSVYYNQLESRSAPGPLLTHAAYHSYGVFHSNKRSHYTINPSILDLRSAPQSHTAPIQMAIFFTYPPMMLEWTLHARHH